MPIVNVFNVLCLLPTDYVTMMWRHLPSDNTVTMPYHTIVISIMFITVCAIVSSFDCRDN